MRRPERPMSPGDVDGYSSRDEAEKMLRRLLETLDKALELTITLRNWYAALSDRLSQEETFLPLQWIADDLESELEQVEELLLYHLAQIPEAKWERARGDRDVAFFLACLSWHRAETGVMTAKLYALERSLRSALITAHQSPGKVIELGELVRVFEEQASRW